MSEKSLHEGHRSRMYEKLLQAPQLLGDHEILEMVLYATNRRGDTNELAHRLINAFGGLSEVLKADESSLLAVKGVGRSTVAEIRLLGEILRRASGAHATKQKFTYSGYKDKLIDFYRNESDEKFLLFLLDGKFAVKMRLEYCGDNDYVEFDVKEVAHAVALANPFGAIMVHNHPSGVCKPSKLDDSTTKQIASLLNYHGVKLYDHIIVAGEDTYSYHFCGRDEILQAYLRQDGDGL